MTPIGASTITSIRSREIRFASFGIPGGVPALILAAAFLAPPRDAVAQDLYPTVPQSLSLQAAVDLAVEYNPSYRQAANNLSPAAWNVKNAYATLFVPTLTANSSITYSGSGSQRFLSTDFTQPSSTIGSNYGLNINWRLDGNAIFGPGVQKAAYDASAAAVDATRMSVRNQVVQQYLAVLEATAQVDIQTRQVERNGENLRLATAQQQVGQRTAIDVRQAEVAKGQSDVGLLQARQLVTIEKLRLFQALGVKAPENLSVVTLSDTFPVLEPEWELNELLSAASADNPDVLDLRAQEVSAARSEKATKGQWLPSLSVSAGWSGFTQQFTNGEFLVDDARNQSAARTTACQNQNSINGVAGLAIADCTQFGFTAAQEAAIRSGNSTFPFNFRQQPFSAGLTISLPIWDSFSRNVQVSQAAARTDDTREALRARELQVHTDVSQQYYGLIVAHETIGIQENNRVSAQEQLRLALQRYRIGSGTFFELLDAQLVGVQAEADYVTALYGYHRALANLEAAVGQRLR